MDSEPRTRRHSLRPCVPPPLPAACCSVLLLGLARDRSSRPGPRALGAGFRRSAARAMRVIPALGGCCVVVVATAATMRLVDGFAPPTAAGLSRPMVASIGGGARRPGWEVVKRFRAGPLDAQGREMEYPMKANVFLHRHDPGSYRTLTAARKAIRRGNIYGPNGIQTTMSSYVESGDELERQERSGASDFVREVGEKPAFELKILYEDDDLAIVDKPRGVPITRDEEGRSGSLASALPHVLKPSEASTEDGILRCPVNVHRIDKPTGGLVLCAKTRKALQVLSEAFQDRKVTKQYRAVVKGELEGTGTACFTVAGREAVTFYSVPRESDAMTMSVSANSPVTSVDVWPQTGRKHQIRRMFAEMGCPILGDDRYGGGEEDGCPGLGLWAVGLQFVHPTTQEQVRIAKPDIDAEFLEWRREENERWKVKRQAELEEQRRKDEEEAKQFSSVGERLNAVPDLKGLDVVEREGFRYYQYSWDRADEDGFETE